MESTRDPVILLLPKNLKAESQGDTCTFVFTAALFTAAER